MVVWDHHLDHVVLTRSRPAWFPLVAELLVILAVQAVAEAIRIASLGRTFNTDAVSYLQVARHYRAGNFGQAVNGYWGAMISWLIAPSCGCSRPPGRQARRSPV